MPLLTLEIFFGGGWKLEAADEEAPDGTELEAESAGDGGSCCCSAACDAMVAAKMEAGGSRKAGQSRNAGNAQSMLEWLKAGNAQAGL